MGDSPLHTCSFTLVFLWVINLIHLKINLFPTEAGYFFPYLANIDYFFSLCPASPEYKPRSVLPSSCLPIF